MVNLIENVQEVNEKKILVAIKRSLHSGNGSKLLNV